MSAKLAGVNRFFTFLIGLLLIALGIYPLLLRLQVRPAQELTEAVSREGIASANEQGWWPWALGIFAVVAALLGIWVILANLNSRRFSRMESSASADNGSIKLSITSLAQAVAQDLEELPGVSSVSTKVAYDRARPTARFTIKADNTVSPAQVKARVESSEALFRDAVEDTDVDTVYQLKLSPIKN